MSAYVDSLLPCNPNKNWKYSYSCHLIADTQSELHDFAKQLGLKRSWYQAMPKTIPHYDLTKNKRKKAVALGAIEVDFATFARAVKLFRKRNIGD